MERRWRVTESQRMGRWRGREMVIKRKPSLKLKKKLKLKKEIEYLQLELEKTYNNNAVT